MKLSCLRWTTVRVMSCVGFLFAVPAPARAQTFGELGGGWSYLSPSNAFTNWTPGWNLRASIGWQIAPGFRWRIDAFTNQFSAKEQGLPEPCPVSGCSGPDYQFQTESVIGLSVNGLVNVDPRGILYMVAGAGVDDVNTPRTQTCGDVSAGAGVAVPVGAHVRAVLEARWHSLLSFKPGPTGLVPVTFGLRF
jgi:hypothetical protein